MSKVSIKKEDVTALAEKLAKFSQGLSANEQAIMSALVQGDSLSEEQLDAVSGGAASISAGFFSSKSLFGLMSSRLRSFRDIDVASW